MESRDKGRIAAVGAELKTLALVAVFGVACGCSDGAADGDSDSGRWLAGDGVADTSQGATSTDTYGDGDCRGGANQCDPLDSRLDDGDASDTSLECGRPGLVIDSFEEATQLPDYPDHCEVFLGSFRFTDEEFENFDDLPYLPVIEGDLELRGNENFVEWSGLKVLEEIGGDLVIVANPEFKAVQLPAVKRLDGALRIENNASLVFGLSPHQIRSVEKIVIRDNPELKDLRGLGAELRTIKGDLEVVENSKLEDLGFFGENLERIEGDVTFRNNGSISEYDVDDLLRDVEVDGETYIDE